MDEQTRPSSSESYEGGAAHDGSERRQFLKAVVTAVAGVSLATGASIEAAVRGAGATGLVTSQTQAGLDAQLAAYLEAAKGGVSAVQSFFAADADFRGGAGIARGWAAIVADQASATPETLLTLRGQGEVSSVKWLASDTALVDGVYPLTSGRGWFTEIWSLVGGKFQIRSARLRGGAASGSYAAVSRLTPTTVGSLPSDTQSAEEAELRTQFSTFRSSFNGGSVEGVMSLTSGTTDAIPVFSFLQGRAQVMAGSAAVATKSAQMLGSVSVVDASTSTASPSPTASPTAMPSAALGAIADPSKRAVFLSGEAKVIRFLSPTLAVIDGTAEIGNIPLAHGFAPSQMRGVYSNVWSKADGRWKGESARPWF
jgi:hypothetical protein